MKNSHVKNSRGPLSVLCCSLVLGLGAAQVFTAAEDHYFDGGRQQTITLQSGLVADFGGAVAATGRPAALAGATPLAGQGDSSVTIYRVAATSSKSAADVAASSGNLSPVYREGDSPAGRLMALPGGAVVNFKPDWTIDRIQGWIAARGLTVQQRLNVDGNWFIIRTAAGSASLEIANAMHTSGDVVSASPNWWKQTRAR